MVVLALTEVDLKKASVNNFQLTGTVWYIVLKSWSALRHEKNVNREQQTKPTSST